jgi:hypothetical protein
VDLERQHVEGREKGEPKRNMAADVCCTCAHCIGSELWLREHL